MFKTINSKSDYISACEVNKLPIIYNDRFNVNLFNNEISLNNNCWLWHFHIKITDACNAKCNFCIEQNCLREENAQKALINIEKMLQEMEKNNCLFSVSVTGGEPTLFPYFKELCEILSKYPIEEEYKASKIMFKLASFLPQTSDTCGISRISYFLFSFNGLCSSLKIKENFPWALGVKK